MTVLIALKTEESVWIGSDGRISDGGSRTMVETFRKWRTVGRLWWAAAGNTRLYTLADLAPDMIETKESCLELCEALRDMARADHWSDENSPHGSPTDFNFAILATDGREIIHYCGDGSYVAADKPWSFFCAGSGADFAAGSLQTATQFAAEANPERFIRHALLAAYTLDQGCGMPFFIKEIEP